MNANKTQIGGSHYQSEYQHWDFVRLCLGNRYLEGCVTKYVARWRKKNGLQDLMKALHYLDKIIELFGAEEYESGVHVADPLPQFRASEFARLNGLGSKETYIVMSLTYWNNEFVLQEIREQLLALISEAEADQHRLDALKAGAGGIGGPGAVRRLLEEGVASGELPGADPGIEVGGTTHGHGGEEPGAGYVDQG